MITLETFRAKSYEIYKAAHKAWGQGEISYADLQKIAEHQANLDYVMRMKKRKLSAEEIMKKLESITHKTM